MKKQFLFASLILNLVPILSFGMNYQEEPSFKILHVFYSLCYQLYNAPSEKDAYRTTKALNKLIRLVISKNTKGTHNKLLTKLDILEPNGCFAESVFAEIVKDHEIDMSPEEYQNYLFNEIKNTQKQMNNHEKLKIFLFDLICFVSHKQERHELCTAFFELVQAINVNNKQLKNPTLIKYELVDSHGTILEQTIKNIYRIPIYLDQINPDTKDIVYCFYFMNARNPIRNPELEYLKFKQNYLANP